MAVDTRDKRFSMMGLLQPVPSILPLADGSVDIQDRAMFIFLYSGISLKLPIQDLTFGILSFMSSQGQGLVATISQDGKGVIATISQSAGVLSIISNQGKGVESTISDRGIGVEDKL